MTDDLMTLNAIARQSAPRLVERYSTSTVASEFIVKFSGFYEESARRGYIAAALAPLSDSVTFQVVPRDNPMAEYPSDFDVVQLGSEHEVRITENSNTGLLTTGTGKSVM